MKAQDIQVPVPLYFIHLPFPCHKMAVEQNLKSISKFFNVLKLFPIWYNVTLSLIFITVYCTENQRKKVNLWQYNLKSEERGF